MKDVNSIVIKEYYKLYELISEQINKIAVLLYEKDDEASFIGKNQLLLDKVLYEGIHNYSYVDLYVLCYKTYYPKEDFNKLYSEISKVNDVIEKTVRDSLCTANITDEKIIPDLQISKEHIKETILSEQKYYEILQKMFAVLYFAEEYNYGFLSQNSKESKKFTKKLLDDLAIGDLVYKNQQYMHKFSNENNKFYTRKSEIYDTYYEFQKYICKGLSFPLVIDSKYLDVMDDEVKISVLKIVNKINKYYYKERNRVNNLLLKDDKATKQLKLSKYYDINKIEEKCINFLIYHGNIDEIINILQYLKTLNYELIDIYCITGVYTLVNTSLDEVKHINELYQKNNINLNFIKTNPDIFFFNNKIEDIKGRNDLIKFNYSLLEKNKFDDCFNELLLIDSKELGKNISLLKKYSLGYNKNLLMENKFFSYVDLLIELGAYDLLKENPGIINDKIGHISRRIFIANLMNLDSINCKNYNNMIITGKDFYVPDSKLEDYYINNVDDFIDKEIKEVLDKNERNIIDIEFDKFDDYLIDDLTYDFDNIFISKNKVLRNLTCLRKNNYEINDETIFNSFIYNSSLTKEQIEKLKNYLNTNKKVLKK